MSFWKRHRMAVGAAAALVLSVGSVLYAQSNEETLIIDLNEQMKILQEALKQVEDFPPPSGDIEIFQPVDVKLSDITFKDITKKTKNADQIREMVYLMVTRGTYKMPPDKKFRPTKVLNQDIAIQMALAVAGIDCGSNADGKTLQQACLRRAREIGLISMDAAYTGKNISKADFYALIMMARGVVPMDDVGEAKKICKDTGLSDDQYKLLATAHKYGLLKLYKGGKCNPKLKFSRADGAVIALKFAQLFHEP